MTVRALLERAHRQIADVDMLPTASIRVGAIALSTASNLTIVALLVRNHDASVYALYALVSSLVALLPFADLGLGSAVVNATADRRPDDVDDSSRYHDLISTTTRLLVCSAVVFLAINLALYLTGGWERALGHLAEVPDAPLVAASTCALILAAIPLGVGNRVLQGLGRMREVAAISMAGPVTVLVGASALTLLEAGPATYALLPGVGHVVVASLAMLRSRRLIGARPVSVRRRTRMSPLLLDALPFLVVSVGLAVGLQSHRLLLANFGTDDDVAEYALAAQFAAPALSVMTTVGQNLWSRYRRPSSGGHPPRPAIVRHIALFTAVGAAGAAATAAATVLLAAPLTGARLAVPVGTALATAFYVVVVAMHQPGAMMLTDRRGFWIQAGLLVGASAVSVPISVQAIPWMGSAAPFAVFSGSMLILQVLPTAVIASRRARLASSAAEMRTSAEANR